jgi:hypothetical protein
MCYTFIVGSLFKIKPSPFGSETVCSTPFLTTRTLILDRQNGNREFQFGSDPAAPGRTIVVTFSFEYREEGKAEVVKV